MSHTVRGANVLVTGAASGMGLLYARKAVAEHAQSVTLWDRDESGLAAAVATLERDVNDAVILGRRSSGSSSVTDIRFTVVDLTDLDQIEAAASEALAHSVPDVLINNAGIVAGNSYFWHTDTRSQTVPTMQINTLAPMHITRQFLPAMIADGSRAKRILNVASAAATVSNPRMSVYAASKWALFAWGDSVRLELAKARHDHVRVTTFCPSYVSTGMFDGAKGMLLTPIITPAHAVDRAWRAMLAGKPVQFTPWAVNVAKVLRGVLPVRLWDRVASRMGVYSSMNEFRGR
ncbi:SDR family NAD(P)-dependent oxidoreductase [Lysinibacter cavernae]|uniref:Short-subunit dehydrogenase n=1 Tax=Lysinibacter cavernae TaxID=1640652 RepID=A0A7X5TU32_9MICO|nr:SDR family NAD(P)-dependent oxidoreductase [Lysinibacter cavernae]NIH53212.1 short-subunit dehydrogenase [Lysinibacter cavernae]